MWTFSGKQLANLNNNETTVVREGAMVLLENSGELEGNIEEQ